MKNRFSWHDKQHVDHSSEDGTMTPTSIERTIVDPTNTDT